MDFFTWSEILRSIILSAVFGASFSVAASFFSVLLMSAKGIIYVVSKLPFYSTHIKRLPELYRRGINLSDNRSRVLLFATDFIKVLCFGILFSIMLYAATDGIFRIYILGISILAMVAFEKLLGRYIVMILGRTVEYAMLASVAIISVLLSPISIPVKFIYEKFVLPKLKIFQEKMAKYSKKRSKNTPKQATFGK